MYVNIYLRSMLATESRRKSYLGLMKVIRKLDIPRSMIAAENRRKSYLGVMKVSRKLHIPFGTWGPVQCGEGCGL